MKPNMEPELILEQMVTLGDIHRENFTTIDASVRRAFTALEIESLHKVYAIGNGDSYHAALSAELAFRQFARVDYCPTPAFQFLAYDSNFLITGNPNDTLVVGISASGGSSKVVESVKLINESRSEIMVAGLVGKPESPVAINSGRTISAQIPELGRSPGIRTYTASIMGLVSLAIRIGEIKRNYHMEEANSLRQEIIDLAEVVDLTYQAAIEPAKKAASAFKDHNFVSFVGSGPSYGSTYFSGAKVVESAGVFVGVQDLEEWAHVERFAYPTDYPVFMVAPSGNSYQRAVDLAKTVKQIGHPIMAVVEQDDKEIAELADFVFPVQGKCREAFSPLLYYIAGTTFAYYLTKELGRAMFMSDNEEVMKARKQLLGY